MNYKKITQEEISSFMEGRDPQERIVNITYEYGNSYMNVFYRDKDDNKCVEKQHYYPFVWATGLACSKLCDGNRDKVKSLLKKHNISVRKLSNTNYNGDVVQDFESGYMFLFFATKPMSYTQFQQFFKEAGNPIYKTKEKNDTKTFDSNNDYLTVTPVEQFMIHTGKRFFKGYDDYDQILRMIFDLETEGLDPRKDRLKLNGVRLNRPVTINGKKYGTEDEPWSHIFKISGTTEEEKNASELEMIELMCKLIYTFKPDVISAHNGENFDWNFLIVRAEMCGSSMEEISKKYFNGDFIKKDKKESVLKLGGEIEKFRRTIVPNVTITDSLHAVRRAQATNSNFKKADLKYSTKFLGLSKKNRVYTPGKEIDHILTDTVNKYAFNNENGDWYLYNENCQSDINDFKCGKNGDNPFIMYTRNYIKDGYVLVDGEYIIKRYLMDDLWECDKVEYTLNVADFMMAKFLPITFSKCTTMGTAGQWKALMLAWSYEKDLAIPNSKNEKLPVGGLSRLLSVGYVSNVIKLDFNSLYPSIILTWGLTTSKDLLNAMIVILEYVLTNREKYKKLKKTSDKIIEMYENKLMEMKLTAAELDDYNNNKKLFKRYDNLQNVVKKFGNSNFGAVSAAITSIFQWADVRMGGQITCIGRQCLRLMISHFEKLGYKTIVGDTDGMNFQLPEYNQFRFTKDNPYIGKGLSRESVEGKEYTLFEADVAEFNDLYMKDFHRTPLAVNKMGLGIDEVIGGFDKDGNKLPGACIQFSRKNYADSFPYKPYPDDVKLVGNSIKSKKTPTYIENFLNVGIRLLLKNKGRDFIETYYEHIEKIYNYQIPLRDIASKGKIKKSIDEYIVDTKTLTKAGRPKSRQAWYELVLKNNMHVDNGDTIYYINTGTSKSQSDVKKVNHIYIYNENGEKVEVTKTIDSEYNKYKKQCKKDNIDCVDKQNWTDKNYPNRFNEDEIILNCQIIPLEIIENETDVYSHDSNIEYNVQKYLEAFNNKVKPLLVCFDRSIRNDILVTKPEDRRSFTEEECQLVSGQPNKPSDQDNLEQLMKLEDKEIAFWIRFGLVPPFLEECGQGTWEEIVEDYNNRKEKEKQLGVDAIRDEYEKICEKLTIDDLEDFIENGVLPKPLTKIISIDPLSGDLVSNQYPEIVIAKLGDFMDMYENYSYNFETEED